LIGNDYHSRPSSHHLLYLGVILGHAVVKYAFLSSEHILELCAGIKAHDYPFVRFGVEVLFGKVLE